MQNIGRKTLSLRISIPAAFLSGIPAAIPGAIRKWHLTNEFVRSVNPIQTRGADYAPHTNASPLIQKAIYTSVIDVWDRSFHAVVVFGLIKDLLFNSMYKFSRNLLDYGLQ